MDVSKILVSKKKIRQSNVLVEATYAQEFTVTELKIFEVILSYCKPEDMQLFHNKLDKEITFTRSELANILDAHPSVISQEAYRISSSLMKKYIEVKNILSDGTIEFQQIGIMPYCQYRSGILTIHWNYRLLPFLLEINSNFTEFQLYYLLSLHSAYAIKLYKLLYQYNKLKIRVFTVNELKEQFGIKNKYNKYNDFKKDVLEIAIKQINQCTNLTVSYNTIKHGRKIEQLEFNFEVKKLQFALIQNETEHTRAKQLIESLGAKLSSKTNALIMQLYQEKGYEYVQTSINYVKRHAKSNVEKYLLDTLTNGYADADIAKNAWHVSKTREQIFLAHQEQEKHRLERERDDIVKSKLEDEWSALTDCVREDYIQFAHFVIKRYRQLDIRFPLLKQQLPLIIYAVNNNKSYDKMLELYMQKVLDISLSMSNED